MIDQKKKQAVPIDTFDIADSVIEEAYPNIYSIRKGMWGHQHIPNFGILRGAIARCIFEERKRSKRRVRALNHE